VGLALAAAAATVAWGALRASSETIDACVGSVTRLVRIPAAGEACLRSESTVSWSVQGPAGPQGLAGPQGPAGPSGGAAAEENTTGIGFMDVTGLHQGHFPGAETQSPWEGWTRMLGFDYSVISPRDAATGQATGQRQHKPIVITKRVDKTTPLFFQALVTNEILSHVTFSFTLDGGAETYRIKLTNASVISDHEYDAGKATGRTLEQVQFTFQTIELDSLDGQTSAIDSLSPSP
jgi:type VI secretion system secreted protein Hcp